MSEVVLAHAGPNGAGLIVFLPILPVVAGVFFIVFAFRDKVDRKEHEQIRTLPNPKDHPLRDIHVALRSAQPAPTASREEKPARRFRGRHLTRV
jgi:hypothetical protein